MNENTSIKTQAAAPQVERVCPAGQGLRAFVQGMIPLLIVCVLLLMQGCTSAPAESVAADAEPLASAASSSEAAITSEDAAESFETIAASFDASALDLDYSNRDKDASYDDASATRVTLSGSTATVDGLGATADGSTVTITQEGAYVVSGSLRDGQLVVEATDTDKVQIVLNGVTIHNEDGPALYVKEADKCFITLVEGSSNVLTDGSTYTLEADSDEPYATLFSRSDLALNGSGTLAVTSAYRHAVCSKDDLVITGGTYVVNAVEDALRGRDCVKISEGTFTLTAGGDGIKSNNDTDATRGFVSVDGGTFTLTAGDDGVQAQTYVRVAGGDLNVTAADDALHSNLEILQAGGTVTIDAGDDALHAETKLVVDDGTVNVAACYEGYEAEKIYINGGNTHIAARDDAVNASAADLASSNSNADVATSAGDGSAALALPGGAEAGATGAPTPPDGTTAPDGVTDAGAGSGFPGGEAPVGESQNERELNGGAADNAFAEGGAGGPSMGDDSCLIQVTGGYTVLDAAGDAVDSNGSVDVTGGVLLVSGPTSGGDGAFDYDLTATIAGGTVLVVGSAGMAQNFTSGEQPFAFATASGNAGQSVAVVDGDGKVVASFTPAKQFGVVLASSSAFAEGRSYSLVVGGTVTGANADGYTDSGTVAGGATAEITASTTATGGLGGLGSGGGPMAAGQGGERGARGGAAAANIATT